MRIREPRGAPSRLATRSDQRRPEVEAFASRVSIGAISGRGSAGQQLEKSRLAADQSTSNGDAPDGAQRDVLCRVRANRR